MIGLDRFPGGGWDFASPSGLAPLGGAAMIGYRNYDAAGLDMRVVGLPAVTALIGFGENDLLVDSTTGRQALNGFVCGLGSETMRIRAERAACIEVRLSPVQAYSLLGVGPGDLGRAVVGLDDLWGRRGRRLRERIADTPTWEQRFALARSFLVQRAESSRLPDPEVVASWSRIVGCRGQVTVGELAESSGWSRKRLWARFGAQIGLTPKRAAMLVRFRHAVEGLVAGRPAADVAVACGYTDQAHLSRDVASFAGVTPGAVAGETLSAVAKRRQRAWGTFFQYRAGPPGR